MNKFTVEEINFMCVFETQNRMKMMEEIRRIMPYIKDSDMQDIAGQVLEKLEGMNDKKFTDSSKYVSANTYPNCYLSYQPEYHVYNTCIGVGEWLCFILFPDF